MNADKLERWLDNQDTLSPHVAKRCVEVLLAADRSDAAFPIAQGLYWYCVDNHGGQGSDEYHIQCSLCYKPGLRELGPDCEVSRHVYECLERDGE